MVWGGFCGSEATEMVEFRPIMKVIKRGKSKGKEKESIASTDYIEQILEPRLLPWYNELKRQGYRPVFMQDDASIHGSAETRLWLRQHGIETLYWPPSSPDLNPDEYMWKGCKSKIRRYPRIITTSKEILPKAQEEWNKLVEGSHHLKYVSTMKERLRDVIKNRGFSTK